MPLPTLNIVNISEQLLAIIRLEIIWGIVGVSAAVFFIVTIVLAYHWSIYSLRKSDGRMGKIIYLVLAGILWLALIGSALRITQLAA